MMYYGNELLRKYKIAVGSPEMLNAECQAAIAIYNKNLDGKGKVVRSIYAYLLVPTEELKQLIMQIEPLKKFKTFQDYHNHYKNASVLKTYDKQYPVIIDSVFGCVIEDGWNRFHSYVECGNSMIPCLVQIER